MLISLPRIKVSLEPDVWMTVSLIFKSKSAFITSLKIFQRITFSPPRILLQDTSAPLWNFSSSGESTWQAPREPCISYDIPLCYKSIRLFFAKPSWISMNRVCMRRPWTFKRIRELLSRLSIASVDGDQHLSAVAFSTLLGFSLQGIWRNNWSNTLDSELLGDISWYQESKEAGEPQESALSPKKFLNHVRCYSLPVIFLTMKIRREHKKLPRSNAACGQLTLLTGGKEFMYAYEGSRSPHASAPHWNPHGFRRKE